VTVRGEGESQELDFGVRFSWAFLRKEMMQRDRIPSGGSGSTPWLTHGRNVCGRHSPSSELAFPCENFQRLGELSGEMRTELQHTLKTVVALHGVLTLSHCAVLNPGMTRLPSQCTSPLMTRSLIQSTIGKKHNIPSARAPGG
jgi:hypothetical protein